MRRTHSLTKRTAHINLFMLSLLCYEPVKRTHASLWSLCASASACVNSAASSDVYVEECARAAILQLREFFFLLCVCAHSTQRERERDAHILAQNNSDCERSTHGVVLLVTDHVCSEHTQTRTHTGRLEFYRVSPHSATAANNIKKTRYECF